MRGRKARALRPDAGLGTPGKIASGRLATIVLDYRGGTYLPM